MAISNAIVDLDDDHRSKKSKTTSCLWDSFENIQGEDDEDVKASNGVIRYILLTLVMAHLISGNIFLIIVQNGKYRL